MGLLNKLFGGGKKAPPASAPDQARDARTAATPDAPATPAHPPAMPPPLPGAASECSLQILYPGPQELLAEDIQARLQAHHASLADVTVEARPPRALPSHLAAEMPESRLFHIAWQAHAIDLAFLDIPLPAPVTDTCLQGAFFSVDLKREASHHAAHALLWYAGAAADRLEQIVSLALVAGALAREQGLAIANENACSAASVAMVCGPEGVDPLEHLQQLPIPMLYAGVKIFEVPHQAGVWARTFGCQTLALPDLAVQMLRPGTAEEHLMLISRVLAELAAAKTLPTHHTAMPLDPTLKVIFHQPHPNDYWLTSPANPLFVLEIVTAPADPADPGATAPTVALDAPVDKPQPPPAP